MAKAITLSGIFTMVVLLIVFGSLPSGDVTDTKSTINNAKQGLAVDIAINTGGDAIEMIGEQAIDSACRDGVSQGCSTATSSFNMIGIAFVLLIIGVIIAAVIGFIKVVMKVLESF